MSFSSLRSAGTFLLFMMSFAIVRAQTIDSVFVMPSNPSCLDNSLLITTGTLPSSNYYIDSTNFSITGSNIVVNINATWSGVGTGTIPFLDITDLGMISPRNYLTTAIIYTNWFQTDQDTFSFTVATCCQGISSFSASDSMICAGETINFTNTSVGGMSYDWLQDGILISTDVDISKTFDDPGTYVITLIAYSGVCSDSFEDTITVNGPPISSSFLFSQSGFQVTFMDQSTGASSWLWDFGDGNIDTTRNPTHTYSTEDTYNVCMTAGNGCSTDSTCRAVTIVAGSISRHIALPALQVYPNPVPRNGIIRLNMNLPNNRSSLRIINLLGKEAAVLSRINDFTFYIDASKLSKGIYYLKIDDTTLTVFAKIIIL